MARPYLFGPVTNAVAEQTLRAHVLGEACTIFGHDGTLAPRPDDTWDSFSGRLPQQPEFLVVQLQYNAIPQFLWQAPVPIIGLAGDWNLLWHQYRHVAPRCDLVLTDTVGVETMTREGIVHARQAHLFGCQRAFVDYAYPDAPRDIDILFVGNFNAAIHRERLPWLARVAKLSAKWNVHLTTMVFDDDYRKLLGRAKIVFNRSIRGECNCRMAEAIAAGALLFQETENRDIRTLLREGEEFVAYDRTNLEERLEYYLSHEDERRKIVAKARQRRQEFTFESLWERAIETIDRDWPLIQERAQHRLKSPAQVTFLERTWQMVSSTSGADPTLTEDLIQAVQDNPGNAETQNALGVALWHNKSPDAMLHAFQNAWATDPRRIVAGMNLAEGLAAQGKGQDAVAHAHRVLTFLEQGPEVELAALGDCPVPSDFGVFRAEWERAAWLHAGNPEGEVRAKKQLVRWALLTLVARLTGDPICHLRALRECPDLPAAQSNVGHALGHAQRPADAIPYLQASLEGNPFDNRAAKGLNDLFSMRSEGVLQMRLARERWLLHRAAPMLVPLEPWFEGTSWTPPAPATPTGPPLRIVWRGEQSPLHSLALVNRELCTRLLARGHELSLEEPPRRPEDSAQAPLSEELRACLGRALSGTADVTIGHSWPPDFTPPADGHWVIIQPWEFGSVPRAWVEPLCHLVDEVWAPSRFVRNAFINSGVPESQVHVIPNGVSEVYFQNHPTYSLRTRKRFKFLFVGGTIERKGIDLLLHAYTQAFSGRDDVCLVIKDMGVGTLYRGKTAESLIAEAQKRPHAPEIEYFKDELSPEQMAGLYRACDCLVHPYRGEGFGLPIAEAMASGLPVIVTGFGAALDFCNEERGYLVPARVELLGRGHGDVTTAGEQFWAVPDLDVLRSLLRHVVDHPDEARAKAQRGQEHVREHFTWDHAARAVAERLHVLRSHPVRRLRAAAPVIVATRASTKGKPRVSLTMIVKNEEHNLADCLRSVADLVDEIIIVDTGSTDRTKEIARQFGAKVVDFPWIDSFAAARNEALRHATGEWIFWMDADDRVDEENRQKLRTLFGKLPFGQLIGYDMKVSCLPGPGQHAPTIVNHVRIFPNHAEVRWKYRVHEQILGALRQVGGSVAWTDILVHHVGYQDADMHRRKGERNHRLLLLDYQEDPNDPYTLFNLGNRMQELRKHDEAIELLTRSLRSSHPRDSIVRKLYSLIAQSQQQQGRHDLALQTCREGRTHYPNDAELALVESNALHRLGDRDAAIACLQRMKTSYDEPHFGSVNAGIRGHIASHNLAILLMEAGRFQEAEQQLRLALAEAPHYAAAHVGFGELCLRQGRFDETVATIRQLDQWPHARLDARTLQAQLELAQRQFAAARETIEEVIRQAPQSVFAHLVLSRIELQEGRDLDAAERALRAVLALDPTHGEARQNLEVLLQKRGS